MTARELRQKFLEFFKTKNHAIISGAPLVPENDPTVLFTTAGMHPLVPYLLGEKHPAGNRLVDVQKCVRTGDIDEVGDDVHLTFFEMLGNWSLGDYFKKEAIEWSWEFLTDKKWLGLDKNRLAVSVFLGDEDAPFDKESFDIWLNLGIPEKRIVKLPKANNWWGPAGQTGPCGPDTEMFYWTGSSSAPENFDSDDGRWVEIWNDVFMQYNKTAEGKYEPLEQKNVDTGMGVERTLTVINGLNSVYETELFAPILKKIEELSDKKYEKENIKPMRIIADHIKATTFMMAEKVEPSNVELGYILRRLIRRAVRYGRQLGINDIFTAKIAGSVTEIYKDIYPELGKGKNFINEQLKIEEEKFRKTLEKGLKEFEKTKNVSGKDAFNLYQTYGFPLEMTVELAKEKGVKINEKEFTEEFKKHQELSRTATAGLFKSGLADNSEQVIKYHTATHLLLAALRKILGEHVLQKGSNLTAERLRLDFSHPAKMTSEEIKNVENAVNDIIVKNLSVKREEMTPEEAKDAGAMGVFEHKYGNKISVYSVGNSSTSSEPSFSREICAGPHTEKTGRLGRFKIVKEEAISAGVRRIRAVLE